MATGHPEDDPETGDDESDSGTGTASDAEADAGTAESAGRLGRRSLDRFRPDPAIAALFAALLVAELLAVLVHLASADIDPTGSLVRYVYPFVLVNVGLWAVAHAPAPTGSPDRTGRALAVVTAGLYAALLAFAGGVVGPGNAVLGGPAAATGFRVTTTLPPGYGPGLLYDGPLLRLTLLPYRLVGYGALAYLVYATVRDAAGAAATGVLGLFSCVSCAWPLVVSVATGVVGASGSALAAAFAPSYGLSAAVYVVTVALLHYRPFGR